MTTQTAEERRLAEHRERRHHWKRWGPYLSERQWGTVREDYSPDGECWSYFPHDHARSRAYRWGEDGLLGITDGKCRLCFAVALWNERDDILKERLFGLAGPEGNHGEDVKECYYYLDSTPTHSYMKALYKYPQRAFPYVDLIKTNAARNREQREYELGDTGIFADNRYFDVQVEYAKAGADDILVRIRVTNRGAERARLHLLPTLWYRNTWSWGSSHDGCAVRPGIRALSATQVAAAHVDFGSHWLIAGPGPDGRRPQWLFTENETNTQRLFGERNRTPHTKDAFHDYVVRGQRGAVNPGHQGTKAAAHYVLQIEPGETVGVKLRLAAHELTDTELGGTQFDDLFAERQREADQFFATRMPVDLDPERRNVVRQAYAGLLWSKQFYHYIVDDWLTGDPQQPPPDPRRQHGRNAGWRHLYNRDVISMPDKWEYPWYAAWDLAFHMLPFAAIDPEFAKDQLTLFMREWYMRPDGQLPAYEFQLGDVNPPVHAWAVWRVYKISAPRGQRDVRFLGAAFQKLLLNFTWWVNRKDSDGRNLFQGGFLGLDNIGVFDRSRPLPGGGSLQQADATAWMAFYCGTMLSIALELANFDPVYEDMASKFFEHFVNIADAINTHGGTGLWDDADGFYYDQIHAHGRTIPVRARSMVGLLPIIAVEVLDEGDLSKLPAFGRRMRWFLENRKDLARHISYLDAGDSSGLGRRLLAIPSRARLERVLARMLDEREFLSPFGLRALSRMHEKEPCRLELDGMEYRVDYEPAESRTGLFGGNSNWRGPIWFPVNFLLIEALERYHYFFGDKLKVRCPTNTGPLMNLAEVANELRARLAKLFLPDAQGRRPCHGDEQQYARDEHWNKLVLFYEYFNAETGRGLGASHQTGWTALVARCIGDLERPKDGTAETTIFRVSGGLKPGR